MKRTDEDGGEHRRGTGCCQLSSCTKITIFPSRGWLRVGECANEAEIGAGGGLGLEAGYEFNIIWVKIYIHRARLRDCLVSEWLNF